jgi:hypothetical protein
MTPPKRPYNSRRTIAAKNPLFSEAKRDFQVPRQITRYIKVLSTSVRVLLPYPHAHSVYAGNAGGKPAGLATHSCLVHDLPRRQVEPQGRERMRFIFGLIVGCALTVGGAYLVDTMSPPAAGAKPMVNWDVVAKNLGNVSALARDGWKKITG